jgi:hypothetical protein
MTKFERQQSIIEIHRNAIAQLVDDETTGIDMFIIRVDALNEMLTGAMAMIDMMYYFNDDLP